MGKRGKKKLKKGKSTSGNAKTGFAHQPFKGLKFKPDEKERPDERSPDEMPSDTNPVGPEDRAYLEEMADVRPLVDAEKIARAAVGPKPALALIDDDTLVMRQLDDLVHGEMPFDFADTDEYIEAAAKGLDRRILRKLKRGDYAYQAHLDLHGLNRAEARAEVADFIEKACRQGLRCVLIIHGRGFGSKEGIPVLKNKLAAWLTRGAIGRKVLAFTSAKPYDGGTGAVYILLRS